jgi:5-methyltetrahydropteroyltriglutamate--homocysteine methyltransferase
MSARFRNTVVGSYPRPVSVADTMKRPTLTRAEIDDLVLWAAKDQVDIQLDTITDGESYRENMYYYYQKRIDGITFDDMPRLSFGPAGFGIECPRVIGRLENRRFNLAHHWRLARSTAPAHVRVKQTVTGPHLLTRFSVNERKDIYADDRALCHAWAELLLDELKEVVAAGCSDVQFDEPGWTESPDQSEWAAEILNGLIARLPPHVRVGLHVCGGNPRRKRVYFTPYLDLVPAFRKVRIQEVLLEYCTLAYDLMPLWDLWDFQGDVALGVIDPRSDEIETVDIVRGRIEPALKRFPSERLVLTSECGFGHVPLHITRQKLATLVKASREL